MGRKIDLKGQEFCTWYPKQERFCHYCGRPIGRVSGKGNAVASGISIDRKDNNGPYSKENNVLTCLTCNIVKRDVFTYDEMRSTIGPLLKQKWQSTVKGS